MCVLWTKQPSSTTCRANLTKEEEEAPPSQTPNRVCLRAARQISVAGEAGAAKDPHLRARDRLGAETSAIRAVREEHQAGKATRAILARATNQARVVLASLKEQEGELEEEALERAEVQISGQMGTMRLTVDKWRPPKL